MDNGRKEVNVDGRMGMSSREGIVAFGQI